jgi:hypothetical protein
MKKVLILFILLPIFVNAQSNYFTLTKTGLIPTNDKDKNHIILIFEGIDKKKLFQKVKSYIRKMSVSDKDVVDFYDDSTITANIIARDVVNYKKKLSFNYRYHLNYTIDYEFKDEAIKISIPKIVKIYSTRVVGKIHLQQRKGAFPQMIVFKKNGKLKTPSVKMSIEEYFKNYFDGLKNEIKTNW